MSVKLNVNRNGVNTARQNVTRLVASRVLVGIPESTTVRANKQPINNATLLLIQTKGSPVNNIPPRPVLEAAIANKANWEKITAQLRKAGEFAIDGNADELRQQLEIVGLVAQAAAQDWFTNPANGWPENTPNTIRAKGSATPLIDTGLLQKAITYVVTDAEGNKEEKPEEEEPEDKGKEDNENQSEESPLQRSQHGKAGVIEEAVEGIADEGAL
jgi:hypothetical protein